MTVFLFLPFAVRASRGVLPDPYLPEHIVELVSPTRQGVGGPARHLLAEPGLVASRTGILHDPDRPGQPRTPARGPGVGVAGEPDGGVGGDCGWVLTLCRLGRAIQKAYTGIVADQRERAIGERDVGDGGCQLVRRSFLALGDDG